MTQPAIGSFVIGVQPTTPQPAAATRPLAPSPYSAIAGQDVIADFSRRLQQAEKTISMAVQGDRVLSQIAVSNEAILISSDKVGIVGEVTFADWQRDLSGNATGVLDPSITQIRGGVIRTGKVVSYDGNSWLDLDANTTNGNPFIRCQSAIAIYADGTFSFGGPSGKQLVWNGTDLSIQASTLISGTAASTVVSNASNGNSAYSQLGSKLNNSSADILSGNVQIQASGGLRAGSITWNSSGTLTGGSGVAVTAKGIVGASGGTPTFTIDATTGAATFAGALSAATGTFAGTLQLGASGMQIANPSNTAIGKIFLDSYSNLTIQGTSSNSIILSSPQGASATIFDSGVVNTVSLILAPASGSGAAAVQSSGGTLAIAAVNGFSAADLSLSVGLGGGTLTLQGSLALKNQTLGTGSATASFPATNKPGSNSANTWLTLSINGTTYYVPAWT